MIARVSTGKVAVKKEDLQKYHGKDTWFQLQPISADSEVQVGIFSFFCFIPLFSVPVSHSTRLSRLY